MEVDDRTLLDRAGAGDTIAIEELMRRYSSKIYRLAFGITRNEADAEEIVQDVFLTMVFKGGAFEGRSQVGSWVYRVATNAALNKRRGKRFAVETSLDAQLPSYTEDGHREGDRSLLLADWSATPERAFLSGEARALLATALDGLPEHYRAVLVLRDVEELSNDEVAEIMGESVASVKSRLHRARMALREQLTRALGPQP